MDPNVGGFDRKARIVVGPILLVVGVAALLDALSLGIAGTTGTVVVAALVIVGLILSATGATQKCPANEMAGLDTTE